VTRTPPRSTTVYPSDMTAHGTPPPAILAPVPRSGRFLTFSLAPGAILAPL